MGTVIITKVISRYDPEEEHPYFTTLFLTGTDGEGDFVQDLLYDEPDGMKDAFYGSPTGAVHELDGVPEV